MYVYIKSPIQYMNECMFTSFISTSDISQCKMILQISEFEVK